MSPLPRAEQRPGDGGPLRPLAAGNRGPCLAPGHCDRGAKGGHRPALKAPMRPRRQARGGSGHVSPPCPQSALKRHSGDSWSRAGSLAGVAGSLLSLSPGRTRTRASLASDRAERRDCGGSCASRLTALGGPWLLGWDAGSFSSWRLSAEEAPGSYLSPQSQQDKTSLSHSWGLSGTFPLPHCPAPAADMTLLSAVPLIRCGSTGESRGSCCLSG